MKLTIEIEEPEELEKLMKWLHENDLLEQVNIEAAKSALPITRGDKSIDPTDLQGIWKDNPRTLEQIRKAAWERKP
jgi:hypothetical protein